VFQIEERVHLSREHYHCVPAPQTSAYHRLHSQRDDFAAFTAAAAQVKALRQRQMTTRPRGAVLPVASQPGGSASIRHRAESKQRWRGVQKSLSHRGHNILADRSFQQTALPISHPAQLNRINPSAGQPI
jgi:hypothetical protein